MFLKKIIRMFLRKFENFKRKNSEFQQFCEKNVWIFSNSWVFCILRLHLGFENSSEKYFHFWQLENFIRKSGCLKKKDEIFEKWFMNWLRKDFYPANVCMVFSHKFTKRNLPVNIVLCCVFVSMISKIHFIIWTINALRTTKWDMNDKILWGIKKKKFNRNLSLALQWRNIET